MEAVPFIVAAIANPSSTMQAALGALRIRIGLGGILDYCRLWHLGQGCKGWGCRLYDNWQQIAAD